MELAFKTIGLLPLLLTEAKQRTLRDFESAYFRAYSIAFGVGLKQMLIELPATILPLDLPTGADFDFRQPQTPVGGAAVTPLVHSRESG